MSEELKARLRGKCLPNKHVDGSTEELCMHCSTGHVEEFGKCVGIVDGLTDYNNAPKGTYDYDPNKVGPEVDVRWEPSGLRYAYHPNDLRDA